MTQTERTQRARSAETREALIKAGIRLFGAHGYEATSTRDLAAMADTNVASIAYHFGNKEGLRCGCAEWIAGQVHGIVGPVMNAAPNEPDAETAQATLSMMLHVMSGFMLARPADEDFIPFMLREIQQPGAVFATIYSALFEPMHKRFCTLWAAATAGNADSEQTRLEVFALIGQLLYFRIGREPILLRMGWQSVGQDEIKAISAVCQQNLQSLVIAARHRNKEVAP